MELLNELNAFFDGEIFTKVCIFMASCRLIMKPITTFWEAKVNPYIELKPTQKLLKHPVYKAFIFLLDWSTSIKLPKDK
jgi:hypothetical protein